MGSRHFARNESRKTDAHLDGGLELSLSGRRGVVYTYAEVYRGVKEADVTDTELFDYIAWIRGI